MKSYRFTVISRNGERLSGQLDAPSREIARSNLRQLGHFLVEVIESSPQGAAGQSRFALSSGSPTSRQITQFTHDLAILLKAGLHLDRALEVLEKDAISKSIAGMVGRVRAQIGSGKSFHEALTAQGDAFPQIYSSMIKVAEASGSLDLVLERIAEGRRLAERLRSKAISAVLYPALLIVMSIAVVVLMLTFVVPRFKQMLLHAGTSLPDSTRSIIAASDWLTEHGWSLAATVAAAIAALAFFWQRPVARRILEVVLMKLPIVGAFIRMNLTVRFCRTLGTLLENGVDLPYALKLQRETVGHRIAMRALDQAYDSLRKGRSFIEPLAASGLFPRVAVNMLRVGEETGELAQASLNVAGIFEDRLETAVQRTFTILEPVIIITVSAFVALMLVSILSAVISINDLAM